MMKTYGDLRHFQSATSFAPKWPKVSSCKLLGSFTRSKLWLKNPEGFKWDGGDGGGGDNYSTEKPYNFWVPGTQEAIIG